MPSMLGTQIDVGLLLKQSLEDEAIESFVRSWLLLVKVLSLVTEECFASPRVQQGRSSGGGGG